MTIQDQARAELADGTLSAATIAALVDALDKADAEAERLSGIAGWLEVQPCVFSHEEPYDFFWCDTHDQTFPPGGSCSHEGLSEMDFIDGQLSAQRFRAVKAEAAIERVCAIHTPLTVYTEICDYSDTDCKRPHVEDRDGDEYHLDGPTKRVCAVCSENEEYSPGTIPWPCPTLEALDGES